MKIVVGLGNPGKRYAHTRHNIGFDVLEELARQGGARFRKKWLMPFQSATIDAEGEPVLLVKPLTFMNRSGSAIRALVRRHRLQAQDLIVVLDDVDLPVGRLRIRRKGGAGGHRGLESIIAGLGTEEFARIRLGIGPRPKGEDLTAYVLGRFPAADRELIRRSIGQATEAIRLILTGAVEESMNRFNPLGS